MALFNRTTVITSTVKNQFVLVQMQPMKDSLIAGIRAKSAPGVL